MPGVYGKYCNMSCPANCEDDACHIQHGTCLTCNPGWGGTTCSRSTAASFSLQFFLYTYSLQGLLNDDKIGQILEVWSLYGFTNSKTRHVLIIKKTKYMSRLVGTI